MKDAPFFWIKQISDTLEEVKEIPLWGFPPAFPMEACASKIAQLLNVNEVKITVENTQLRPALDLVSGLGSHLIITTIELSPLAEPVYWLMAQEDVRKVCAATILQHSNGKGLTTTVFQEGFYRFLSLHVVEAIDQLGAFKDLSLKIASSRPLTKEEALCMDIGIHLPKQTVWGRIVCTHSFRQAFKSHFSMTPSTLSQTTLAKGVDVSLRLEIGRTELLLSQWNKVKVGDFILLDHCSYDPTLHKGTATLVLNDAPLLRARLKGDSLKIVDYAFYHEDIMNEQDHFEEDEEEEPSQESEDLPVEEENPLWSSQEESPIEDHISPSDIQLSLTVEVGRLKINLDKLLHLKPGNVLELSVRPEQGVDLSIGGKKMAKAELIKLGDVLGVKILHLE